MTKKKLTKKRKKCIILENDMEDYTMNVRQPMDEKEYYEMIQKYCEENKCVKSKEEE